MTVDRSRRSLGRAALALLLLAGAAAGAHADPVDIGPANLALDTAWTGSAPASPDAPVVRRHPDGAVITLTRAAVGNLDAWRRRTRDRYYDAVEAGFAASPGYVRLGGRRPRLGKSEVPALDLTFRRKVGGATEVVAVRILLFRTTTIAAAAAAPDTRAGRKLVEAAVATLVPDV